MRKIVSLLTIMLFISFVALAQGKISGTVKDQNGDPVPFATVKVKGSKVTVAADANANFSIAAKSGDALIISAVGLQTTDVTVATDVINVVMTRTSTSISDVVVTTALGVKREAKSLGYSTATVTNQELTQARVTNVTNGLSAKVAGVDIRLTNNGINPAVKITFRGSRSITGNNAALIIVDGNPVEQSYLATLNPDDVESESVLKGSNAAALYGKDAANGVLVITTKHGKKNGLNVNYRNTTMLEQVSYLPKLQTEYSPYGGEGGGYNNPAGDSTGCIGCVSYVDPLTGKPLPAPFENQNYGPAYNSLDFPYTQIAVGLDPNGNIKYVPYKGSNDGRKNFFQTGLSEQNDLSVTGGGKIGSFFISGSNVVNKGVIPTERYTRNTITGNGKLTVGNFTATAGITYSAENIKQVGLGFSGGTQYRPVYWSVINQPPHVDLSTIKDVDNDPYASFTGYVNGYYPNPWYQVRHSQVNPVNHNVITNLQLDYKLLSWLTLTARGGYNKRSRNIASSIDSLTLQPYNYGVFADNPTYDPWGAGGTAYSYHTFPYQNELVTTNFNDLNLDGFFTVTKQIKKDFGLILLGGANYRSSNSHGYWYSNQATTAIAIPSGSTKVNNTDGSAYETLDYKYRSQSVYGDLNLDYQKWIFLHGSYRNDWLSILDPKTRSFNYYGADVAILLIDGSNVNKISPGATNSIVSYLKIRGGYSITGNSSLAGSTSFGYLGGGTIPNYGAYSIYPTVTVGSGYPYADLNGYSLSTTAIQSQLKPEKDYASEVGIELGLLKNRINLDITAYSTDAKNQNLPVQTSTASGINNFTINSGVMNSKGYEVTLKLNPLIKAGDFSWNGTITFSQQDNKIKSLLPGSDTLVLLNGTYFTIDAITGNQFPSLLVKDFIRDDQGRIVVNSTSGLPTVDPNLKVAGNTNYRYFLGLQSNMTYKGVTFSMVWDYRGGAKILNTLGQALDFAGISTSSASNREHFIVPNSVYKDASGKYIANTNIPITGADYTWWFTEYSPVGAPFVVSSSFWKLREASLGYDIPIKAKFIKRLNFALIGQNLLMIRPHTNEFTDPEFSAQGTGNAVGYTSEYQTPPTRRYGFSISASF